MIRVDLEKEIIDDVSLRFCQIYIITNLINKKVYVGQAVSHILNHKRYRPYGMTCRFNCHVSEAFSTKTKQCHYLNNSIRKHGKNNFKVELLCNCLMEDADRIETEEILKHNSLFPIGYNLKTGGQHFTPTEESKKRVSVGVIKMMDENRMKKYKDVIFDINKPDESFIKVGKSEILVIISGIKTKFTQGSYMTEEQNYERCIQFIRKLKTNFIERQGNLVAGTSLES
jgi:hypothetical protein